MRRKALLISGLLLALILLSAIPAGAKGPPRIKRDVVFNGALVGEGELYVDEKGTNVAVYGYMEPKTMTFNFGPYKDEEQDDFGLRLTFHGKATGEVKLGSGFDVINYEFEFPEDCFKPIEDHTFGGSGTYSYIQGVYYVTLEEASFSELDGASTNRKCQGYSPVYVEKDAFSDITFTVEIGD